MQNKAIKLIGWLLAFLLTFDGWLFISLQTNLALYTLLVSVFILYLVFRLFLIKIKSLEIRVSGISHVLEKSEEKRIDSEQIKNKVIAVTDDLPEGLLVIDKYDKISVINNRAEKLLGVNRRQVLNQPILELSYLSNVKKIVFPLLLNFKGIHKEEIELRKNLVLNLTIEPLVLGKNNVAKLVVLNDITKDKQDEVLKNEFISMTAHQLKTPLSNTRLALKMMIAGDFGKISKKQKEILEKTYKNNDSLIYLVQDLIQDVKNSENSQFNDKSYVDLPSLTDSVVELYSEIIKAKKIKFKLAKVNGKLPKVSANSERIKMVIQNLLDNAIKYTPENGNIEISIKPKKTEVEFKIKDSGIGIPEEQKERIFTRFLRGINTTGATGSGLGLAIAKDIIKKSHGKIWFLSKENEGSTFFFSLPTMGN